MGKSIIGILMAAVLLCLPATSDAAPAGKAKYELRLGNVSAPQHPYNVALVKVFDEVREKTNGEVNVTIYPSSQLGSQREMTESVSNGVLDAVCSTAATLASFAKTVQVCDIPFLFKDREHSYRVFDDPELTNVIFKGVPEAIGPIIGFYDNGTRQIISKALVKSPADMAKKKMRVLDGKAFIRMAECLGAAAIPLPYGELYTALQQGTVDLADQVITGTLNDKLYEVAPQMTITNHSYSVTVIIVSPMLEKKIGAKNYKILVDTVKAHTAAERKLAQDDDVRCLKEIEANGGSSYTPTDAEMKAFRDACAPMWGEFDKIIGGDLINKILAKAEK